jgi:hypothetical protein
MGDAVPEEDSQLTWQGGQQTIMAELGRQRAAAAAAHRHGESRVPHSAPPRAAATPDAHIGGRSAGRPPRSHSASVIQARQQLRRTLSFMRTCLAWGLAWD